MCVEADASYPLKFRDTQRSDRPLLGELMPSGINNVKVR